MPLKTVILRLNFKLIEQGTSSLTDVMKALVRKLFIKCTENIFK